MNTITPDKILGFYKVINKPKMAGGTRVTYSRIKQYLKGGTDLGLNDCCRALE